MWLLEAREDKKGKSPLDPPKEHWTVNHLIVGLLTSRNVREKFVILKSTSCAHLLQQQKEINTVKGLDPSTLEVAYGRITKHH